MGWNAYLYVQGCKNFEPSGECLRCDHRVGEWNYTHNLNGMIAAAMESSGSEKVPACIGPLGPAIGPAWWDRLDGLDGAEGHFFLRRIIDALTKDPNRYRAMNPSNGWGNYDGLVQVLTQMRDASAVERPDLVWSIHG